MTDQTPPPDELASVRDKIAELKEREAALRTLLLTDPSARSGNRYIVEIVTVTTSRTDLPEMRKMYPDLVAEFTFPHRIEKVELREIDAETGEIIARPRRKDTE